MRTQLSALNSFYNENLSQRSQQEILIKQIFLIILCYFVPFLISLLYIQQREKINITNTCLRSAIYVIPQYTLVFNTWVTSGKGNRSAPTSWRSCVYIYTSVDKRSQIYFANVSPVVLFGSSLMRFGNRSIAFCTIGGRSLQAVTEIGRGCV